MADYIWGRPDGSFFNSYYIVEQGRAILLYLDCSSYLWFVHYNSKSILLYGCTTWTLTKRREKKLNGNYTRMLRAKLNKSWRQHPTKQQQLYGHLPPITKTIKIIQTRHVGHCWRSRDELIHDILLWIPSHGRAKAGRPACTYIQQLCMDTGCSPEDLPEAMNDREEWREMFKDIRGDGTTRWWWYYSIWDWTPVSQTIGELSTTIYIYIYI